MTVICLKDYLVLIGAIAAKEKTKVENKKIVNN
jgi:hypothetical protein